MDRGNSLPASKGGSSDDGAREEPPTRARPEVEQADASDGPPASGGYLSARYEWGDATEKRSVELDVSNDDPPVSGGYLAARYEGEDAREKVAARSNNYAPIDEETAFAAGQLRGRVEISQDDIEPMPLQYLEEPNAESEKKRAATARPRDDCGEADQRSVADEQDQNPRAHSTVPGIVRQRATAPSPSPASPDVLPGAPAPILMYSVEAVRVDTESEGESEPLPEPPRQTVYDAVLVVPWWKQKKRLAGVLLVALMVGASIAVAVVFSRQAPTPTTPTPPTVATTPSPTLPGQPISSEEPAQAPSGEQTETDAPTPSPPVLWEGISNVTYLGDFLETSCSYKCEPTVEVSGDTAVLASITTSCNPAHWEQNTFQIFNKTAGSFGSFEPVQALNVSQPSAIAVSGDTMVVGSGCEALQTGAAYIYERNSTGLWSHVQRIGGSRIDTKFGAFVCPRCVLLRLHVVLVTSHW